MIKKGIECFLVCSFISIVGMMLGGSVLAFSLSGDPAQLLAGPIIILFGWFYLPVVFVPISLGWLIYNPKEWNTKKKLLFILSGGIMGFLVFDQFGIRGPEAKWEYSYQIAGYISGIFCFSAILALKQKSFRDILEEHYNQPNHEESNQSR